MRDETLIKKAHEIYLKESREEVNRLIASGALVNYREFSYEQFLDAGCNPENPWYSMFNKKFDHFFEKAKNE